MLSAQQECSAAKCTRLFGTVPFPKTLTLVPACVTHIHILGWQVYWANSTTGAMVSENPITDADIIVMKRRRDKGLPYQAPQLVDDDLNPLPGGEDLSAHPY